MTDHTKSQAANIDDDFNHNIKKNIDNVSDGPTETDALADEVATTTSSIQELQQLDEGVVKKKKMIAWNTWRIRSSLKLWEAVALSKNIAPSRIARIKEKYPKTYKNYQVRLKTAISWLNVELNILDHPENGYFAEHKMVELIDFVKCAEKKQVKMPQQLLDMLEVQADGHERQGPAEHIQTKKKSTKTELRNVELQKAAHALALDMQKREKVKITKGMVALALHKGEWSGMDFETIKRNTRVDW